MSNCEKTPQSIWPIAKSLLKRDGPRAPTAIHGPLGITFLPLDKANAIADCFENQFTPRDGNHEWQLPSELGPIRCQSHPTPQN
jgi:hypothetical protein